MKNKKLIKIIIVLFLIGLGVVVFIQIQPKEEQFPPLNVECFDHFMEIANGGYADGFHIPPFNFEDISYFRCASQPIFNQYEISGIDKDGHTFYVHKDEGGRAPSGSDSVYNLCYKKDNIIIRNDKLHGRETIREIGTCFWTDNFPLNPTSTYEYISK